MSATQSTACTDGTPVLYPEVEPDLVADCQTLLQARDILSGDGDLNWSESSRLETWQGVEVGGSPRRVVGLHLHNQGLTGVIPSELGMLTGLETLDLSHNRLTGAIPSELGSLDNIRFLRLHATRLSGSIPVEFGNLKNLVTLDLGQTHLTGEIPRELGGLPNLRELFLGSNFHTGELPAELTQLPNLRALNISNNRLSGCVPTELRDIAPNIGAMRFCGDPLPIRSDTGSCSMVASIWA